MIQAIRNRLTGWAAVVVILIMGLPFVLLGVGDFFVGGRDSHVALVNDVPVSDMEFRDRWNNYREMVRRQLGENFDPRTFDQPLIRRQVLDDLLREEALVQASRNLGMVVGDVRVREAIAEDPTFQTDGRFDQLRYDLLLRQVQMSPTQYQERVRRAIASTQLTSPVATSSVVGNRQAERYIALRDQERDFDYLRLPRPEADLEFVPEDEAVETFHRDNAAEFMTQEQVVLSYVLLREQDVNAEVLPDERDLRERYEAQSGRFTRPERRLVSHILAEVQGDGDAEAHRAALERAQSWRLRIEAGEDFAEVAREVSQDLGSSRQGGDLGWISRGDTEAAFEDVAFGLEAGSISEPVLSSAGYHLVQVRDAEVGAVIPFEEAREELVNEALASERERLFFAMQERAMSLIDQRPDDIDGLATELGLSVETTEPFGRFGGPGIASRREVQRLAFSEFLRAGLTLSDLIDLGDGEAVVLKVERFIPSTLRPLEEVRDIIVERLRLADLERRAEANANELDARLQSGESLEQIAASLELEVVQASAVQRFGAAHPPRLVREVFRLPRPEPSGAVQRMLNLGAGEFALVRLTAVRDADGSAASAEAVAEARRSLADAYGQAEASALSDAVFRAAKITVAEERLQ